MKKLLLLCGLLVFGVACNSLQKKEDNRASKMIAKMTEVCQLTPDQAGRLKPLLENFIKSRVENKDKYASDQVALVKADSTCKKTYQDSLKKILTPDQFAKLKAFHMEQMKQKGKGGDQDNGGQE